ncbi:MAG: GatB/YqeY domain-containing protein [Patescibacteria group bacterium]
MSIRDRIEADIKEAMTRKEADRLSVLRLLKNALHNRGIADRTQALSEDTVLKVLKSEAKKRKEAMAAYQQGNRPELAAQEAAELRIIESYLPAQLDEAAIGSIVDAVLAEQESVPQFGVVMKAVMARTKGQADGALVSQILKTKLDA